MVADFSKKQKREFFDENFLFKAVGVILLGTIAFFVVADIRMYQKKQQLKAQISAYEKQIADLKKSSENIKEQIANADNKDYLEKVAYEQLGQQKPGERQVIFVMPESKTAPADTQEDNSGAKVWLGWFTSAWDWIKSKF